MALQVSRNQKVRMQNVKTPVPFLKWAGGKRWLCSRFPNIFPTNFNCYFEPFLGSAAVYFHVLPPKALLSDINGDLVSTYDAIKDDWHRVVDVLQEHAKSHTRNYYYKVRECKPDDRFERAARFLYLNRTCWNGLYRVNKKGDFNVPIGTKNSVLLDSDDFRSISSYLERATIQECAFTDSIDKASNNDFIFADPPYTACHNANGFLKYNENIFSWDNQVELRDCLLSASNRGAKFLLTNADHPSVEELYEGHFSILRVHRHSVISGKAEFRVGVSELIISNFYISDKIVTTV